MSTAYVYRITNTLTGDCYVGKTTLTPEQRFMRHKQLSYRLNARDHFHRALKKYGASKFVVETLEIITPATPELLNQREIHWIAELKPHYNSTLGGDGYNWSGRTHSEASKEKMRLAKLGQRRKPHTPETKEKMRIAAQARIPKSHSPETLERMRASQQKRRLREKKEAGRTPAPGGYASHNA